jgi:hypothetical protein
VAVSKGVRAILGTFGRLFQAATDAGRGAANMWATYKGTYANLGREAPPATIQDMNLVVAGLGSLITTSQALARAADSDALTSEHISPPIGYEPSGADRAVPSMLATFEVFIDTEEGLVSRWSTLSYNSLFPATVGELRNTALLTSQASIDQNAAEEGDESPTAGGTVASLGQMYITGRGL